jgi:hypothetical protein
VEVSVEMAPFKGKVYSKNGLYKNDRGVFGN